MVGVALAGETPSLTREFESSLESGARAKQASCTVPCLAPPSHAAKRVALAWRTPKALPPNYITDALRQRNMVKMKEQIKTPEKELSDKEPTYLMQS